MAPELRFDAFSALCSLGPRADLVTGFLRQWFIQHFAEENNIEQAPLRYALWQAVDTSTGIEIESITRWKPQTTGKRPAVIISRNDWEILRFGINDIMMGDVLQAGVEHYAAYIRGSHTLFCLSHLATEAELLAAEVYREMMQFGPKVRESLELKKFQVLNVGKLFELEEARENYAVPVTVAYGLEEKWRVVPHAPVLKRIVLSSFLP